MIKYKKLNDFAHDISQAYHSPGYDFYSSRECVLPAFDCSSNEYMYYWDLDEILYKNIKKLGTKVSTGIAVEIPTGYVGVFRDRSSIGNCGIIVVAGVIDPDYRGEVQICLVNLNVKEIKIPSGTKIAQMLVLPCLTGLELVDELSKTYRGAKGFGSSGL